MLGFILTVGIFFSLGAVLHIRELLTNDFPHKREPIGLNVVVVALLIELSMAAWAWHLWITTP